MATIRKIVPSGQISDFRQSAPDAGGGFRLLAGALDQVYNLLEPQAIAEETAKGSALGREMAKQQIGGGQVYASSSGGGSRYRDAIASIESGGRYDAVGPTDAKLGRALGKYQIMEANVGPWSREALGREVTADEFLANPGIQDAIFDHKFGGYVSQFGEEGAAQAWFAGPGGVGKTDRKDVLGTDVGSYGQRFMGALGGGQVTMSSSGSPEAAAAFAPTMMREADGKLVSKLYDPSSSPILQAHNAAAGADYQAQVFLKGSADLMAMRDQFTLDPDGFKAAADSYLEGMVEAAPDMFKGDIRSGLTRELQQTFLGLLDEKQRDIRQRSANSNSALVEKWGDNLGAAIAGGDPKEIAGARSQLSAALSIRERLPGQSWTPEQSDNVIRKAEEDGMRRIEQTKKDQQSSFKKMLDTITSAAKQGLSAANEHILDMPEVAAMLPDEYREAMAFTTLRDNLPSFMKMPPKAQDAAVAEMRKNPIDAPWEGPLIGSMEDVSKANKAALKEDPIKRFGEIFPEDPPPIIAPLSEANPQAFVDSLAARNEYAQRKAAEGYTATPVLLSKEEAATLGEMFGKDIPPEMKAIAAGAIVGALGADAQAFFKQIKTTDGAIQHVGMMLAAGGDQTVATEAMRGQDLLDQKMVPAPSAAAMRNGFAGDMETAVMAAVGKVPEGAKAAAMAIYASRIPANADEDTQAEVMAGAWQSALGQTVAVDGETVLGGVQTVGQNAVLLPPGVSAKEVDTAIAKAFDLKTEAILWGLMSFTTGEVDTSIWEGAAGGKIPAVGGVPISRTEWSDGKVRLLPVGGNDYALTIKRVDPNTGKDIWIEVGVQGQPDTALFTFDVKKLIEAAQ